MQNYEEQYLRDHLLPDGQAGTDCVANNAAAVDKKRPDARLPEASTWSPKSTPPALILRTLRSSWAQGWTRGAGANPASTSCNGSTPARCRRPPAEIGCRSAPPTHGRRPPITSHQRCRVHVPPLRLSWAVQGRTTFTKRKAQAPHLPRAASFRAPLTPRSVSVVPPREWSGVPFPTCGVVTCVTGGPTPGPVLSNCSAILGMPLRGVQLHNDDSHWPRMG